MISQRLENSNINTYTNSSIIHKLSSRSSGANKFITAADLRLRGREKNQASPLWNGGPYRLDSGYQLERSPIVRRERRRRDTSRLSCDIEGTVCSIAGKQAGEETQRPCQHGLRSPPAGETSPSTMQDYKLFNTVVADYIHKNHHTIKLQHDFELIRLFHVNYKD